MRATSIESSVQSSIASTAASWVDGKRWFWLLSPALPLLGLMSVAAVALGASPLLLFALPVFFYGAVPLLDVLIGDDRVNAPETAVAALEADRYYRNIVYAYIPSQYIVTGIATWLAVTAGLPWWGLLGLIVTTGMVNGVGINTAHELGHKTGRLERWLAKITLAPVAYGHFFIEHNKGHHRHVATPEDPASSRMGETFWAFLPRSVVGSARSAWRIERDRLTRKGESVWSRNNENLQAWAMTIVLFGALTIALGPWALAFLAVQAIYGFSLLEVVNYLEHYGLLRQKLESGRYERCQPCHSWNSNHVVTNLFLYQLQRHSDHHANPTRRYQSLRHFADAPQLPAGYATMILAAYIPPLWFRLMNPKVAAHHGGDLTHAHLHAPRREALLARWSSSASSSVGVPTAEEAPAATVASSAATRHACPNCDYVYDESQGCPDEGFKPGTSWQAIPADWACPQCAVREKLDFRAAA